MHGASVDAEGQAHLPLHVPAQERVHLLRERPPAVPIPARDRHHEGLRRRLESRGRRRADLADPTDPITPPPQPTRRTGSGTWKRKAGSSSSLRTSPSWGGRNRGSEPAARAAHAEELAIRARSDIL